jgi:hypothetical protein
MPKSYIQIGIDENDKELIEKVKDKLGIKSNVDTLRFLLKQFLNEK